MKRLVALIVTAVLVTAATLTLTIAPATAAIAVNETADELNADGDCSLREAVETLNTGVAADACPLPVDDQIVLAAETYPLDSHLDVGVDMHLLGAGAASTTLDCGPGLVNACIRVLNSDNTFRFEGISMVNAPFGGIHTFSEEPTHIVDSLVDGTGTFGVSTDESDVFVTGSTITGAGTAGVQVLVQADVVVEDSTIADNFAGGVASINGDVTVIRSTLADNSVGVHAEIGEILIDHSTIVRSQASGVDSAAADVTVVNSTIADNGLHGVLAYDADITIESSTIVDNSARAFSYQTNGSVAFVRNSILANDIEECDNEMTSGGYNITNDALVGCDFDQPTDQVDVDPQLGSLGDNGGPTQTYLPQAGSPAIDRGGECPDDDQRGETRPSDGDDDGEATCDIGAVELQPDDPTDGGGSNGAQVQPASAATAVPAVPRFTG